MPPVRNFVTALAVAGKTFKDIEETVKTIYSNKALKKMQLYEIIKKVKEWTPAVNQRLCNSKGKVQNPFSSPMLLPRLPVMGMSLFASCPGPWRVDQNGSCHMRILTSLRSQPDGSSNFSTRR
jgi:hypothetical protein